MTVNPPDQPGRDHFASGTTGPDATREFGDVKVSTGHQSAYITIELILYLLASLAIFVTAAVIDEDDNAQGFGAAQAWFYVTLLTIGFMISRALSKIAGRNGSRVY
jgi:hypothetical protein